MKAVGKDLEKGLVYDRVKGQANKPNEHGIHHHEDHRCLTELERKTKSFRHVIL